MKCTVDAAILKRALIGCAGAVCKGYSERPALAYAHIKVTGEVMTFTALDGFRMVRYELAAVKKPLCEIEDGEACILPEVMLSMLHSTRGLATIASDGHELRVKTDVEIAFALPEKPVEFIDVEGIWPKRNRAKTRIAVNPKLLIDAMRALDTGAAMVLEIPENPVHAIEIRGDGTKYSTRGMVLPIRVASWGDGDD